MPPVPPLRVPGAPARGRRRRGGVVDVAGEAEGGAVTAEAALALPALVGVLAVALAGLRLGLDEMRCLDGATAAARLAARGEADALVVAEARRLAPEGARVALTADGPLVVVTVAGRAPRLLAGLGAGVEPAATVRARREPGSSW